PHLWAVLDEAVLARPIGGPDVLRRQMLRLVEVSELPTVTIQGLPFAVGAHRAGSGSVVIPAFADDEPDPVVSSQGLTGGVLRTRPEELRSYQDSFESLRELALSPARSRDMISALTRGERN